MMDKLAKIGRAIYKAYVAVGIAATGFLAGSVIFTVIMRYFFGITFIFLEELITLVFASIAFWCVGICALENDHVVVDFLYNKIPPKIKRYIDIFNMLLVISVVVIIDWYSLGWIKAAGKTLSVGMRVKYVYIYGAMPVGLTVSLFFLIYKLVCTVLGRPVFRDTAKEDDKP